MNILPLLIFNIIFFIGVCLKFKEIDQKLKKESEA